MLTARLLPVAFLLMTASISAQPVFEVASLRPAAPGARPTPMQYLPGGRFMVAGASLSALIQEAFGLRVFQISGGPAWLNSDRFDVSAKAPSEAGKKEIQAMLQALLAERFKLVLHRESRELTVYVLEVAKNGSKLKAGKGDDAESGGGVRFRGPGKITGLMATPAQLASALSDMRLNGRAILDRPVLDRTGLSGVYDFNLEWTPDGVSASDSSGPSIFTAVQEQLGLKLESQKAPVDFAIIDQATKPSEN